MEPAIEWYVCRHGKTIDNQQEIWTGQLSGELGAEGIRFAQEDLGQLVRLVNPDDVWSSRSKRAKDTKDYAIESAGYKGRHSEDKRLCEVRFTEFDGKTLDKIKQLIAQHGVVGLENFEYYDTRAILADQRKPLEGICDIEPIGDIRMRVISFSQEAIRKQPNEKPRKIISIGHGMINAYIVEHGLYGTCGERVDKEGVIFYPQKNNSVTILRYDDKGTLIESETEINVPIHQVISRITQ